MTDKFKFDPEHTFFTSDTHFGHANIINLCNRPFKDVNHMNNMLVENWNSVVSDDDTVFHLGDFALGGSAVWQLFGHVHSGPNPGIRRQLDAKGEPYMCTSDLTTWIGIDGDWYRVYVPSVVLGWPGILELAEEELLDYLKDVSEFTRDEKGNN